MLERLKKDNLIARKAKNKAVSSILTTLIGEAEIIGKNDGNRTTTSDEVLKVITKFNKGAKEMLSLSDKSKHDDIKAEIAIYESYLPTMLDENELRNIIVESVNNMTSPKMGVMMGWLKTNYSGQYDGKMASTILREIL